MIKLVSDYVALKPALDAARNEAPRIETRRNVVAFGTGEERVGGSLTGQPAIKVFVQRKISPERLPSSELLPRHVTAPDGARVRLDIEEMAPPTVPLPVLTTRPEDSGWWGMRYTGRGLNRIPLAGASGAHLACSLGTIAACVIRRGQQPDGRTYIISCNHVLADFNRAFRGAPIVQPAPLDGGIFPWDCIAELTGFVPLRFGPAAGNIVDAAMARTPSRLRSPLLRGFGPLTKICPASEALPGAPARIYGRSLRGEWCTIQAIHATVRVNYWALGVAGIQTEFRDQLITTQIGEFGDSGSVMVDAGGKALGMLFAGSWTHSFFNYFENIGSSLGVML